MICYGLMDPPEPPYILILMSSIQGVAFNVLWVRTLWPSIDLHLIFILTTSVDNLMMMEITMIVMIILIMITSPASGGGLHDLGGAPGPRRHGDQPHGDCHLGRWQRGELVMLVFNHNHDHALYRV